MRLFQSANWFRCVRDIRSQTTLGEDINDVLIRTPISTPDVSQYTNYQIEFPVDSQANSLLSFVRRKEIKSILMRVNWYQFLVVLKEPSA